MKRMLAMAAFAVVTASAVPSIAGPTVGDIVTRESVDKGCVASVFSYLDGSVTLRGQARFDHFKRRFAPEPNDIDRPFMNFVAIGGQRYLDDDPETLPQCRSSARLP